MKTLNELDLILCIFFNEFGQYTIPVAKTQLGLRPSNHKKRAFHGHGQPNARPTGQAGVRTAGRKPETKARATT